MTVSPVAPAAAGSASRDLSRARTALAEARETDDHLIRYSSAHVAALRIAAAVLAVRARPVRSSARRRVQRNAWVLLSEVAPEFGEWATFFAAGAAQRAAAEAGLERAVTTREADDLVRAVEAFYDLVDSSLHLATQPPLPEYSDSQSVLAQPWMQAS
ncbi:SAV_6107 family HEPN domain-containing protein [Kribbella sp. CA-293567]|uniref:SAV_6107 family HEPN domain-containing protein n=1 Tax=Kribbella sp. CA-293567 TaxID=3002436 RepID=UPI0022DE8926|nr:SAV_6107 family HEPN domain-containing protein [Kribbella sp. CA-293567]WBQ02601.1 SAV_6107 family HEPN domain-containing protein [Kribbella sp. CA-293567]